MPPRVSDTDGAPLSAHPHARVVRTRGDSVARILGTALLREGSGDMICVPTAACEPEPTREQAMSQRASVMTGPGAALEVWGLRRPRPRTRGDVDRDRGERGVRDRRPPPPRPPRRRSLPHHPGARQRGEDPRDAGTPRRCRRTRSLGGRRRDLLRRRRNMPPLLPLHLRAPAEPMPAPPRVRDHPSRERGPARRVGNLDAADRRHVHLQAPGRTRLGGGHRRRVRAVYRLRRRRAGRAASRRHGRRSGCGSRRPCRRRVRPTARLRCPRRHRRPRRAPRAGRSRWVRT